MVLLKITELELFISSDFFKLFLSRYYVKPRSRLTTVNLEEDQAGFAFEHHCSPWGVRETKEKALLE